MAARGRIGRAPGLTRVLWASLMARQGPGAQSGTGPAPPPKTTGSGRLSPCLRDGRSVLCFGPRSTAFPGLPSMDVTASPPSPPSVCPRAPGGWSGRAHTPGPAPAAPAQLGGVAPATTDELLTARGGRGGTVRVPSRQSRAPAGPTAAAAEGGPSPGGGPEVRSGLMSSKASGRGPASQLVRRCRPVPGVPAPPTARGGRAAGSVPDLSASPGQAGPLLEGHAVHPSRSGSRGTFATSEFSGTTASRPPPAPHGAARGAPQPPGQAGARGASIALWSGQPRCAGAEPAPAPRPPCPGSAPGARP